MLLRAIRLCFLIPLLLPALAQDRDPTAGDTVLTVRSPLLSEHSVDVSRKRFEDLLATSGQLHTTPALKRAFAENVSELLAFAAAAQAWGMDTGEAGNTSEWLKLQKLAGLCRRKLDMDSRAVSAEEIEEYYRGHLPEFDEVKLRRMLVPRDRTERDRKALEITEAFRERAAAGENLDLLQREAWKEAGLPSPPPSTEAGNRRRTDLSAEAAGEIFPLKAGEVSAVEKEPWSFVVYKVEARRTVPCEEVREEIARAVSRRKRESALKSVTAGIQIEYNENYFGPSPNR